MLRGNGSGLLRSLWMLLWLLPVMPVAAVSLGDMVVSSTLGEPLRAYIPVTLQGDESLAELHITLASVEEYEQRHIPRAELLQGMRLALLDRGKNKARLQLFGDQPWQGEEARLLLIVNGPGGLLELPYKVAAITPAEEVTPIYVEVQQNETLDQIAIRLSEGRNRSYLHMMYSLFLVNTEAFYRGNMNNLKTGTTLRVPSDDELYSLTDRQVFRGIRQQYEQWQQLREPQQSAGTQAGAALAGMSAEQASSLSLTDKPDALQQQLQQVIDEGEAIRQENEELRQRLKSLEQRMQSVTGQVLDYAGEPPHTPPQSEMAPENEAKPALEEDREEGLSASTMFSAIVMVLLFAFYIIYSTGHKHRGRS